jgi:hypothetical protein
MLLPLPMTPAIEAVLQIAPRAAFSAGAAAWAQRNGPIRLVVRIVDQNSSESASRSANGIGVGVEPAQRVDGARHHPLGLARPGDVAGRSDDPPAFALKPLDRGGPARIVGQMVQCHDGAAARKDIRRGEPDARGRPGHQHGFAGEIRTDHVAPLSRDRLSPGSMPPPLGLSSCAHRRRSLYRGRCANE